MTRAQAVLDWIGHWLDGEVSPRYEVQTPVVKTASGKGFR